jgi:hypothetical protein
VENKNQKQSYHLKRSSQALFQNLKIRTMLQEPIVKKLSASLEVCAICKESFVPGVLRYTHRHFKFCSDTCQDLFIERSDKRS